MSASSETLGPAVEDELVHSGQQIYESRLRSILEPDHNGRFVAIEPQTSRYFLGDTGTAALIEARRAMPDKPFYLVRIGHQAADTLSGYGNRIRLH